MKKSPLKINIFYCSNSLDSSALKQGLRKNDDLISKLISLPCSGKVNFRYLLKAFEAGADGVVLITCKEGECNFLEGNLRAIKRAKAVESILEEAGIRGNRMKVISIKENGFNQVIDELMEFCKSIRKIKINDA